ncbi:MAG: hypothetical protein ACI8Q1_001116 [Parvicella sp.]|jgi:hypothetical protein
MKKVLSLLAICFAGANMAQQLVSINNMASFSSPQVTSYINGYGWSSAGMNINPVDSYSVTYKTTDLNGDTVTASGAVYIPQLGAVCNDMPVVIYDHGTEFVKADVPSNGDYVGQALYFSTTGYICVLPDYLGMGVHAGIHPYQHAETEATAGLDLLRAVREWMDSNPSGAQDNGQLFVTGYSQGGHSAMATDKFIEENALTGEFNVMACAPLSGAFDMSGAQFDFIFDGDSNYVAPAFLPYVLGGYQAAYGTIYNAFEDIYDPSKAAQIETYLNSPTTTYGQWNSYLGTNHYEYMQDSVIQNIKADLNRDTHPINVALRANDLYDWIPNNSIRMIYCGGDDIVSANNSINTLNAMTTAGATDVQGINIFNGGNHNSCFNPATQYALTWFDSLSTACQSFVGVDNQDYPTMTVYPNPVVNVLTIEGYDTETMTVSVYSLSGQVFEAIINANNQMDVSSFADGIYFVDVRSQLGESISRMKFVKL